MTREADISKGVRKALGLWEFAGTIVWYSRLQSGMIQKGPYWIRLCEIGTPDYVAVIRNRKNNLSLVFFEIKIPNGRLRPEQQLFRDKIHNNTDVLYFIVTSGMEIDNIMVKYGIDKTLDLPSEIG